MPNPWFEHMKTVRAKNPGKSLKEIMIMAKKTYKRSPVTKAAKKRTAKHKKPHSDKKHKKRRRKSRSRTGGNPEVGNDASKVEAAADVSSSSGDCPLPARDGSGTSSVADKILCGTAGPLPPLHMNGGKRKSKKSSRKRRSKRKTRKKR